MRPTIVRTFFLPEIKSFPRDETTTLRWWVEGGRSEVTRANVPGIFRRGSLTDSVCTLRHYETTSVASALLSTAAAAAVGSISDSKERTPPEAGC